MSLATSSEQLPPSEPDAGAVGGAKSPEPAPAPATVEAVAGVVAPAPKAKKAKRHAYTGPPVDCEHCGRRFKNPGGLGAHKRFCKAAPAAKVKPAPAPAPPIKLDEWLADQTPEEGAQRAAAVVDEVAAKDGGVVEVIARMEAAEVGIPDLIALVCLRALPPPLSDAEYAALRVAWKDSQLAIPPWLMTLMVTLAVIGPRAMMHPQLGPWIRAQLVGKPKAEPRAAARPAPIVTPAPEPISEPPAPAATTSDAKEQIRKAMEGIK